MSNLNLNPLVEPDLKQKRVENFKDQGEAFSDLILAKEGD